MLAGPRRFAPTREAKTARRLLWMTPTALYLLIAMSRVVVTSEWFSHQVATEIAGELAARSRSAVQMSGVTFGWDLSPCFQDFEIYRFSGAYKLKATTKQACIERWASAVGSGFHAIQIKLENPSISVEGSGNAKERGLTSGRNETLTSSTGAELRRAALREIQVVFDDLRLDWETMPFPENFARGTYGPIDGTVTL